MIDARLTGEEVAEIERTWPDEAERMIASAENLLAALADEISTAERVCHVAVDIRRRLELSEHVQNVHDAHGAIASEAPSLLMKLTPAPLVRRRVENALAAEQIAYARLTAPKV